MLAEKAKNINKLLKTIQNEPPKVLADELIEAGQRNLRWIVKSKEGDYYPVNKNRASQILLNEFSTDLDELLKDVDSQLKQPSEREKNVIENLNKIGEIHNSSEAYVRTHLAKFTRYFNLFISAWNEYEAELNSAIEYTKITIPNIRKVQLELLRNSYTNILKELQEEMKLKIENVDALKYLINSESDILKRSREEVQLRRLNQSIAELSNKVSKYIDTQNNDIVKLNKRFDKTEQYFKDEKVVRRTLNESGKANDFKYNELKQEFETAKKNAIQVHGEVLQALQLYKTENIQQVFELHRELSEENQTVNIPLELNQFAQINWFLINHNELFKYLPKDNNEWNFARISKTIKDITTKRHAAIRKQKELELQLITIAI